MARPRVATPPPASRGRATPRITMTSQQRRLLVLSLLALPLLDLCASTAAEATTIRPPKDLGHLARMSRAVVLARASTHWVEDRGLPITITSFELEQSLGGRPVRSAFDVGVPGGERPETAAWIAGAPSFKEGRSYLLFLARSPRGRWRPQMLAYGLLWGLTPRRRSGPLLPPPRSGCRPRTRRT